LTPRRSLEVYEELQAVQLRQHLISGSDAVEAENHEFAHFTLQL
jgi:hypothetical protein